MPIEIPLRWKREVPLAQLTAWRIGGPARFLSTPSGLDELRTDIATAAVLGLPVFALGAGSNLLFPDAGYPGLLIRLPADPPRFDAETSAVLLCPAGASLPRLARQLARDGWHGLEWAGGIPGTVGGAVVNNAGAYGGSIADLLVSMGVLAPDGAVETWEASRLALGYRTSALKGREPTDCFVLSARLRLIRTDPRDTARRFEECQSQRATTTPGEPSCGCVFRNPEGRSAGRLIQEAGLSGHRIGQAQISPRHANYIVNLGEARAREVLELIELIRGRVQERTGTWLELEIQPVGFGARFSAAR